MVHCEIYGIEARVPLRARGFLNPLENSFWFRTTSIDTFPIEIIALCATIFTHMLLLLNLNILMLQLASVVIVLLL